MKNTFLILLTLAAASTGFAQVQSNFGAGIGLNFGVSLGAGTGYMGTPVMPPYGNINTLYGVGMGCGGGGGYYPSYPSYPQYPQYPGTAPIAPYTPIAGGGGGTIRPPFSAPGIPGMGPGPVGPRPMPPIAMPLPMPMPMPGYGINPCIVCSGAIAGGGFYAPPPVAYQNTGVGLNAGIGLNSGLGLNGGFVLNGGMGLGGNGNLIAALGMGLAAQTTNVYPVQPQRFVETVVQPYPVFYGGSRDSTLIPRASGHTSF